MKDKKSIKAIHFDIKQKLLDKYYMKSNSQAYYDIYKFMSANGFEHSQGSGYLSNDKINIKEIYKLLDAMHYEMPWTIVCIDKIDITEKYMEIQNTEYSNKRVNTIQIFDEILEKGYMVTPDLVSAMSAYTMMQNEILNLESVATSLENETNPAIIDVLESIQEECTRQDAEKERVSEYLTKGFLPDLELEEIDMEEERDYEL